MSIMKSAPRLLHPTRHATLTRVRSQTRPRRKCKLSFSAMRQTLHPAMTRVLGMELGTVSVLRPHDTEL